jgi:hypothetical protein
MEYTKEQLTRQRDLCTQAMAKAVKYKHYVKSPDFQLAKDYGEEVRENHLSKTQKEIEFWQKRIINLNIQIIAKV